MVNPALAPMALSSFLVLLNLVFDSRSTLRATSEGVADINGGGDFIDDVEGALDFAEEADAEDDGGVDCS